MKLGSVVIYALCKNCFPDLAQGYSSDNNFVNCSEISAVTLFGICLVFLKIPIFAFFTPPYCSEHQSSGKTKILNFELLNSCTLYTIQPKHCIALSCTKIKHCITLEYNPKAKIVTTTNPSIVQ